MQEAKALNNQVKEYDDLINEVEELEILIDLVLEEEAYEMYKDISTGLNQLIKKSETFKLNTLLLSEFDKNNAIISIHSGAEDWRLKTGQKCFLDFIGDGQIIKDLM